MSNDQPLTAQVVLRSSSSSETSRVVDEFRRAGFDIGPLVANNFSISGPRQLFERYFGSSSPRLDRLPEDVRPLVLDIVTTRIDFGPTNW